MRRIVLSLAMLMGLAQSNSLLAGVYNLDPPRKYPSDYVETHVPQPLNLVIDYLNELRQISRVNPKNPPGPGSLRSRCEKQLAQLEMKQREGGLDVVDQVNLGACLIRLQNYAKAQEVLEGALRQVPRDSTFRFLLLLNLAAVCQEDDSLLQRALELQREALESWPAPVPGWNREESIWYHHAEQYTLALMQLRNRERILRGDRPAREQLPPYQLFPREERDFAKKVQFIGSSGEYEAGGIAWAQLERLPADADQVVLQLLLWRPHDPRLLWLFGELLNARGRVDSAYDVLNRVRENDQWRNRELDRHLRVLGDALAPYRELFTDSTGTGENRRKQALLLWSLAPRGTLLAPTIGVAANEIGGAAASASPAILTGGRPPSESGASPPANASRSGTALPDWRQLTVSFVTGMVVAVLGVLQWQQWRRHRRLGAAERSSAAEHFTSQGDIAGSSRYSRPADG
jgi:tetratricopeptide (TPR) repeat protein